MLDAVPPDAESDPIDADDPAVIRAEVLRLRDLAYGEQARAEVLSERVAELETELHALGAHADALQTRLDRSPLQQARRLLGRARRAVAERR